MIAAWARRLLERLARRVAPAEAAPPAAEETPASAADSSAAPGAADAVSSDATQQRVPELGLNILGMCPGAPELQTLVSAMHVFNAEEQIRGGLSDITAAQDSTVAKEMKKSLMKSGVEMLLTTEQHIPGPSRPVAATSCCPDGLASSVAATIDARVKARDSILRAHRMQQCIAARVRFHFSSLGIRRRTTPRRR